MTYIWKELLILERGAVNLLGSAKIKNKAVKYS